MLYENFRFTIATRESDALSRIDIKDEDSYGRAVSRNRDAVVVYL